MGKKVDFEQENRHKKSIGALAEKAVIEYEIELLKSKGINDAEKIVKRVSEEIGDGLGFDILSYEEVDGILIEKYIEVKGTKGGIKSDFYLSRNELEFSKEYQDKFYLYRVFNLAKRKKMYVLHGSMYENLELIPQNYKAYIKE